MTDTEYNKFMAAKMPVRLIPKNLLDSGKLKVQAGREVGREDARPEQSTVGI